MLALLFGAVLPETALAVINDNNLIDQVVDTYRTSAGQWQATILNTAMWMFWTLAVIEVTWTGMRCG